MDYYAYHYYYGVIFSNVMEERAGGSIKKSHLKDLANILFAFLWPLYNFFIIWNTPKDIT